jgi:hypothetical protein
MKISIIRNISPQGELLDAGFLFGLLLNPEAANEMFFRIVSWLWTTQKD